MQTILDTRAMLYLLIEAIDEETWQLAAELDALEASAYYDSLWSLANAASVLAQTLEE